MKAFLQELAEEIYRAHADDLSQVTVVFPNRRAALYFRKYLGDIITQPVFSPQLLTFEDFVSEFSDQRIPDKLELVMHLFRCYNELMVTETEPFDQFFMWGEMLLRDFDEVDRYMVDAKVLFADLRHLKELDSGLDYLSDEQKKYLKDFWSDFDVEQSANKRKFIEVWQKLYPLYKRFNDQLLSEGLTYEGHLHRRIAEELTSGKIKIQSLKERKCWFAGFNALTTAEEKIISYLIEQGIATAHWDTDQYYINDGRQEAGHFLRQYKQHAVLGKTFSADTSNHLKSKKNIELLSAAQPMGQVKLLSQILEHELKNEMIPEESVIILADEKMLMPVLHSISPVVNKFNVTMGFPLASSPVFNLVELLVELQFTVRKGCFNFASVQSVLLHPYIVAADAAVSQSKLKEMVQHNWVSVPANFLAKEVLLHSLIFKESLKITEYILAILNQLMSQTSLDDLDKEYIFKSIQLFNRLDALVVHVTNDETSRVSQLKSFLRLFRQYARGEKIPFVGEPLKGIQVMGVLESRNLDFKNVFILSLNEGIFPSAGRQGSYIPYSIRKAYGLPTPDHQGSIYAYLFYRSLQRAQNIFLFYNSEPDVLGQGEMSRYLQQLIYESGLPIKKNVLHNVAQPRAIEKIKIQKDEEVLRQLAQLNEGGRRSKGITPSALNTYLDCSLKFYFQYVARIRESQKVQEEIDPRILGNILHLVMEKFYKAIMEKKRSNTIDASDFDASDEQIKHWIDQAFIKNYYLDPKLEVTYEGQRVVVREVVKKFAKRITELDKEYAPFTIKAIEQNGWLYNVKINCAPGFVVLGGTIDRVDLKEGRVRVIDYKTGRDELDFKGVNSLFFKEAKRNKAAFQTLLYALIYKANSLGEEQKIIPGLINRNNLFDDTFQFGLKLDKIILDDATPLLGEFENHLCELLEEIFNPELEFVQTERTETCKLCPYKEICYK
ncbi:MAG TPA: PD-(D/E)XK nuclease family protein [Cytophagales bacterium]|jgi:CRISPR/Cas system-associated exonuclease Cas4 (RecB family)|nr:PD-(D/E)XK nuclease family protein [Cytophagales bacterium]